MKPSAQSRGTTVTTLLILAVMVLSLLVALVGVFAVMGWYNSTKMRHDVHVIKKRLAPASVPTTAAAASSQYVSIVQSMFASGGQLIINENGARSYKVTEPLTCTRPAASGACIEVTGGNIDIDFQGFTATVPTISRLFRASGTGVQAHVYNGIAQRPVQQTSTLARAIQSQRGSRVFVDNFHTYNFTVAYANFLGGSIEVDSCVNRQYQVGGSGQLFGGLLQSTGVSKFRSFDTEVYPDPSVASPVTSFGLSMAPDSTNQGCGTFEYDNVRSVASNPFDFHCATGGSGNNLYGRVRTKQFGFGMQIGWAPQVYAVPTQGQWNNVTVDIESNAPFAEGVTVMAGGNVIMRDLTVSGPANFCNIPDCGDVYYSGSLVHFYPAVPPIEGMQGNTPVVAHLRGVTLNPTSAGQAAVIIEPSDTWFYVQSQPKLQITMNDVTINSAAHGVGIWQDFDVSSVEYSNVKVNGGHTGVYFEHNARNSQLRGSIISNTCIGTQVGADTSGIQVKQNIYQNVNTPQVFLSPVLDQANLVTGLPAGDCSTGHSVVTAGSQLGFGQRDIGPSPRALEFYKSRGIHADVAEP